MPSFDAAAAAALDEDTVRPAFFAYLDINTDPVRATTFGKNVTFSGTGDAELDGFTFDSVDPTFVNIGSVVNQEGGSETVTCTLSGIQSLDTDLLTLIATPTNWRGRVARLWMQIKDENNDDVGAIVPYYTGRMVSLAIMPSTEMQTIEISIENYLASLSSASNRSYLGQKNYDAADTSAAATISAANGANTGPQQFGGGGGTRPGERPDFFPAPRLSPR